MFVPLVGDGHIPISFSYIQGKFFRIGIMLISYEFMFFPPETGCENQLFCLVIPGRPGFGEFSWKSLDFRILTVDILSMSM